MTYINHKSDNRPSNFQENLIKYTNSILKENNIEPQTDGGTLDFLKTGLKGYIEIPEGVTYFNPYCFYSQPIIQIKLPSTLILGGIFYNPIEYLTIPENCKMFIISSSSCKYIVLEGNDTSLEIDSIKFIPICDQFRINTYVSLDLELTPEEQEIYDYISSEEGEQEIEQKTQELIENFKIYVPDDAVESYKQIEWAQKHLNNDDNLDLIKDRIYPISQFNENDWK